jgi:hypothetical protein
MEENVPLQIKIMSAKIAERVGLLRQFFTTSTNIKVVDKLNIEDLEFESIFNHK